MSEFDPIMSWDFNYRMIGIQSGCELLLLFELTMIWMLLRRQFWRKLTLGQLDLVLGHRRGNYWPQRVLMLLLQFGNLLVMILNVYPL